MKRCAIFLLLTAASWAQVNSPAARASSPRPANVNAPPRISRTALAELERAFDDQLRSIGTANDPLDMLGATRGLYLEGYGVVFTTELSLVISPAISPFRPVITPELREQVHARKRDRLPKLKQVMRDFLRTAAMKLSIPGDQQVVVAVRLDYVKWEDTLGLPGQVTVKADKQSAALDRIQLEEQ